MARNLTVTCDECGKPIEDGHAFVEVAVLLHEPIPGALENPFMPDNAQRVQGLHEPLEFHETCWNSKTKGKHPVRQATKGLPYSFRTTGRLDVPPEGLPDGVDVVDPFRGTRIVQDQQEITEQLQKDAQPFRRAENEEGRDIPSDPEA